MPLECSWAPLSSSLWTRTKLLCSYLCMFDAIVELHAMNEKMFNDFFIGKCKWILYVIKACLIHVYFIILFFAYVVKAFCQI